MQFVIHYLFVLVNVTVMVTEFQVKEQNLTVALLWSQNAAVWDVCFWCVYFYNPVCVFHVQNIRHKVHTKMQTETQSKKYTHQGRADALEDSLSPSISEFAIQKPPVSD